MKRKACYAVKKGYKPGLYFSWDECLEQVSGFRGASYKKFSKKEDAQKYLDGEFDDSDLFLTQEETSNLSINNIELIEYIKKDKNMLDLKKLNKFGDGYYIFTDGSNRTNKQYYSKDGEGNDNKNKYKSKNHTNKKVSSFGIYFGELQINIAQIENDKTNNYCELVSIKYVMELLDCFKKEIKILQKENPNTQFNIISDSKYCVDSINLWLKNWQKNGWKLKSGDPVKNKEILSEIFLYKTKLELHKINYKLIHVNSHQPPPLSDKYEMFLWKGNQYADYLARYED